MVTFGGAYAVLPYVAQEALHHGWLGLGQMVDGLGLADTTPGPLIMVLQFVGFLAAWQQPEGMPPLLAATLAQLSPPGRLSRRVFSGFFSELLTSNACMATLG